MRGETAVLSRTVAAGDAAALAQPEPAPLQLYRAGGSAIAARMAPKKWERCPAQPHWSGRSQRHCSKKAAKEIGTLPCAAALERLEAASLQREGRRRNGNIALRSRSGGTGGSSSAARVLSPGAPRRRAPFVLEVDSQHTVNIQSTYSQHTVNIIAFSLFFIRKRQF